MQAILAFNPSTYEPALRVLLPVLAGLATGSATILHLNLRGPRLHRGLAPRLPFLSRRLIPLLHRATMTVLSLFILAGAGLVLTGHFDTARPSAFLMTGNVQAGLAMILLPPALSFPIRTSREKSIYSGPRRRCTLKRLAAYHATVLVLATTALLEVSFLQI